MTKRGVMIEFAARNTLKAGKFTSLARHQGAGPAFSNSWAGNQRNLVTSRLKFTFFALGYVRHTA